MPTVKIARTPTEMTPEWLTAVLRERGVLSEESVSSVEVGGDNIGLTSQVVKLTLQYEGNPPDAPRSLVAKVSSKDEVARQTGLQFGVYEAEMSFYRDIARTVDVSVPQCLVAEIDPDEGWFTLLLEDISPTSRPGDTIAGGTVEEAHLALTELAKLHASRWNDPALKDEAWSQPEKWEAFTGLFPASLAPFLERFGAELEPEQVAICERVVPRAAELLAPTGPFVVLHGDYRLDNMFFGLEPGTPALTVFDWQTSRVGSPLLDAAYYLGGCLSVEDRRQHESDLLREYHRGLIASGVEDFPWDDLWEQYRRNALYGVIAFAGSSVHVERTERGDALYLGGIRQFASQALDLDSEHVFVD